MCLKRSIVVWQVSKFYILNASVREKWWFATYIAIYRALFYVAIPPISGNNFAWNAFRDSNPEWSILASNNLRVNLLPSLWGVPCLATFYPGISLTTEERHGKNLSGYQVPVDTLL
jgi:hypothetical protein